MVAYVVVEIEVTDPEGYEEYKQLSGASVAQYGGRFLVRGGRYETLEGDWAPGRFVLLEFDSVESAKRWWSSPEYERAKQIRWRTATTKMIVVEGV